MVFHPTAIAAGYTPVLHAHTAQVAATITEIIAKIDPRTGQPTEEKPKTIKTGDSAIVKITPLRPVVLETFKEFPELGQICLERHGVAQWQPASSGKSPSRAKSRRQSQRRRLPPSSTFSRSPSLNSDDSAVFEQIRI